MGFVDQAVAVDDTADQQFPAVRPAPRMVARRYAGGPAVPAGKTAVSELHHRADGDGQRQAAAVPGSRNAGRGVHAGSAGPRLDVSVLDYPAGEKGLIEAHRQAKSPAPPTQNRHITGAGGAGIQPAMSLPHGAWCLRYDTIACKNVILRRSAFDCPGVPVAGSGRLRTPHWPAN